MLAEAGIPHERIRAGAGYDSNTLQVFVISPLLYLQYPFKRCFVKIEPHIIDVLNTIKNKKVNIIEIWLLEKNMGFSLIIFIALPDL